MNVYRLTTPSSNHFLSNRFITSSPHTHHFMTTSLYDNISLWVTIRNHLAWHYHNHLLIIIILQKMSRKRLFIVNIGAQCSHFDSKTPTTLRWFIYFKMYIISIPIYIPAGLVFRTYFELTYLLLLLVEINLIEMNVWNDYQKRFNSFQWRSLRGINYCAIDSSRLV